MQDLDLPTLSAVQRSPSSGPALLSLASQQQHLQLLLHLSAYSELLVLICGDAGSGKSTLSLLLQQERHGADETLALTAEPGLELDHLVSRIAAFADHTGLSQNRSEALDQLRAILQQRYRDGGGLVVIIDDADSLPAEILNDISYLALLAPKQLAFVLLGRSGYEERLRSGPTAAPSHVIQLEPLSESEAKQLLAMAQPSLNDAQQLAVFQRSSGYPADLLQRVPEPLRDPTTTAIANPVIGRFPLWHIIAVALVGCVTVMAFLYQEQPQPQSSAPSAEQLLQQLEQSASVELDYNYDQLESLLSTPSSYEETTESLSASEVIENPVTTTRSPLEADSSAAQEAQKHSHETLPEVQAVAERVASEQAKKPQPAVKATSSPSPSRSNTIDPNANGYVVQVLGVKSRVAAQQYVDQWQSKLSQRLYIVQSEYQGAPWYVVVAGVYTSDVEAKKAASHFPKGLVSGSPWVRNLGQLR